MKFKCTECQNGPCKLETKINENWVYSSFNCDGDAVWLKIDEEPKPKESEFMTLPEAISKIKIGDEIRSEDESTFLILNESGRLCHKVYDDECVMMTKLFDMKWQIIPSCPKVLSMDELWSNYWPDGENEMDRVEFEKIVKAAEKNGQLKRDLDYKPLMGFIGKHHPGDRIDVNRLYEIYVDIKKLKES